MTTPAWLQNISDQLDEQHRQFEAPFEALINAYDESLQREEAAIDEQHSLSEQLERQQEALRTARFQLDTHSGTIADSKKYQELDGKYRQLKTERIELLHTQSQNTQRLLQLNEQLQDQQLLKARLEEEVGRLKASLGEQERRSLHNQQLLEEKNLNIQILQDELQALQLELLQTDEKVKSLQSENQQLVQRWLSKVNETVDRLNAEFTTADTSTSTDLNCQISGLVCSETSDLLFLPTKTGGILSRALETTLSLSIPIDAIPENAIFSRDSDLLIGCGESEAELANIWSIQSGKICSQLSAGLGKGFIDFCCLPSTNDAIISVHQQNLLRFYDLPRSFCLWTEQLEAPPHQVRHLSAANSDTVVVLSSASADGGRPQIWDIRQRKRIKGSSSSLPGLTCIATSQNHLLACTNRSSVIVIDSSTLKSIQTIPLQSSALLLACYDSHFVASIKSKLIIGDHTSGKIICTINEHEYPIVGMGFITAQDELNLVAVDSSGIVTRRKFNFSS